MKNVTLPDCEALLTSVGNLGECDSFERFHRTALVEIAKLVGSDHATFIYMAPTFPKATVLGLSAGPGLSAVREGKFARRLAPRFAEDPVFQHFLATGDGAACKISDFLPARQYHALPLYQRFYREWRCEDQMAFRLFPPGSELVTIALARPRRNFTERDRQILNLVRPHVARAYRRVEQLERAKGAPAGREAGPALTRVTTVRLDAQDRPVQFCPEAKVWLNRFFPEWPWEVSGLPKAVATWLRRHRDTCPPATAVAGADVLVQEQDGKSLRLRVTPGLCCAERVLLLDQPAVRPVAPAPLRPALTGREIEILLEVEKGRSNGEVSLVLGISSLTVRKHLENIFQKLHVPCRLAAAIEFRRRRVGLGSWLGSLLVDWSDFPAIFQGLTG